MDPDDYPAGADERCNCCGRLVDDCRLPDAEEEYPR